MHSTILESRTFNPNHSKRTWVQCSTFETSFLSFKMKTS